LDAGGRSAFQRGQHVAGAGKEVAHGQVDEGPACANISNWCAAAWGEAHEEEVVAREERLGIVKVQVVRDS
jgi:hypothetical protein